MGEASRKEQVASQNQCYVNSLVCNYGILRRPRECRRLRSGLPDMRLVALVMVTSMSSWADAPENLRAKPTGPSRVIEVQPWEPPARVTTKVPGIDGKDSAGIVIQTDPGGDARPWPYGAWIKTPDVGDRNVLELGSDRLPGLPKSQGLAARLSRGFDQGVDALLDLVMPPAKLVR